MKILLAADGSPCTRVATRQLLQHLKWFSETPEVHIVHVRPPLPYPRAAMVAGRASVEKYEREESEAALAVSEGEMRAANVGFTSCWRVGDVAQQLAEYVKRNAIDLVVMGSHGRGAAASAVLGSVTMQCIALLEVPVMIARAPA
jgi:nucleotide-binding universal stress UspA family protein